jgi:Zn-dependent M32 family carboxypeptidase
MDKFVSLFQEYIVKAVTMTEAIIAADVDADKLDLFTANRERLFSIIEQISRQIDWNDISADVKNELNRQMDFIKKLDEKLVVKLQEHQEEVRKEIERTHRNNENLKGYNLNDVK